MRVLCANLDCEIDFARARTPGPHPGLPARVASVVARASAWMAVLAEPGDALFTLTPIEDDDASGVARISGELPSGCEILAWGETEAVAAARGPAALADDPDLPWQQRLWRLRTTPAIAAAACDRRFAAELGQRLGTAHEGARVVLSRAELLAHLAEARLGPGEAWVLKAPLSAAGRERLRRRGRALAGDVVTRVDRLLARYGELCFEPWVDRVADLGRCGVAGETAATLLPPHRMECDSAGVVRAILVDDDDGDLSHDERDELDRIGEAVGEALVDAGYRGPFSIDAYLYMDQGVRRLQALGEINARMTFGHLARAAADRAGERRFRLEL